jgi:hypothetical protein
MPAPRRAGQLPVAMEHIAKAKEALREALSAFVTALEDVEDMPPGPSAAPGHAAATVAANSAQGSAEEGHHRRRHRSRSRRRAAPSAAGPPAAPLGTATQRAGHGHEPETARAQTAGHGHEPETARGRSARAPTARGAARPAAGDSKAELGNTKIEEGPSSKKGRHRGQAKPVPTAPKVPNRVPNKAVRAETSTSSTSSTSSPSPEGRAKPSRRKSKPEAASAGHGSGRSSPLGRRPASRVGRSLSHTEAGRPKPRSRDSTPRERARRHARHGRAADGHAGCSAAEQIERERVADVALTKRERVEEEAICKQQQHQQQQQQQQQQRGTGAGRADHGHSPSPARSDGHGGAVRRSPKERRRTRSREQRGRSRCSGRSPAQRGRSRSRTRAAARAHTAQRGRSPAQRGRSRSPAQRELRGRSPAPRGRTRGRSQEQRERPGGSAASRQCDRSRETPRPVGGRGGSNDAGPGPGSGFSGHLQAPPWRQGYGAGRTAHGKRGRRRADVGSHEWLSKKMAGRLRHGVDPTLALDAMGYGNLFHVAGSIGVEPSEVWSAALESQHEQFGSRFELLEYQQSWWVRACRKHSIEVLTPASVGVLPQFLPLQAQSALGPAGPLLARAGPPQHAEASANTLGRRARRKALGLARGSTAGAAPVEPEEEEEEEEVEDEHAEGREESPGSHLATDPRAQRDKRDTPSTSSEPPHVAVVKAPVSTELKEEVVEPARR